jgi:hypothetical protein
MTLIEVGQDFRKLPGLRFRVTVLPFIFDLHASESPAAAARISRKAGSSRQQ